MVEKSLVLGIEMQTENGHVGTGWEWEGGTNWESWHWHIYATICKIYPGGSARKESACNAGDLGSIPGLGRCPGEGNGCPVWYSGLENSVDCIDHGVAKSWTRLSTFHFHFSLSSS